MKKKVLFTVIIALASLTTKAQYTTFDPNSLRGGKTQVDARQKKGKKQEVVKDRQKVDEVKPAQEKQVQEKPVKEVKPEVCKIDPKYGLGTCPDVDGHIQWNTTIQCPGMSAKQIYDKAIEFLVPYCKETNKDPNSRIAVVNENAHEIGARIGEYIVFQSSALSLDRAMFHYTLCIYCSNGSCKVVMKDMSYKYEDQNMPVEEMLLDANAINKKHTDFCKGGYKKFRIKTIDAKDALFNRLSEAINKK